MLLQAQTLLTDSFQFSAYLPRSFTIKWVSFAIGILSLAYSLLLLPELTYKASIVTKFQNIFITLDFISIYHLQNYFISEDVSPLTISFNAPSIMLLPALDIFAYVARFLFDIIHLTLNDIKLGSPHF